MKKNNQPVLQMVHMPQPRSDRSQQKRRTNGKANGHAAQLVSRGFDNRFELRYNKMPSLPTGLEKPSFSESAEKILKERYLLKGGQLEVVETIEERFWHVAYDIASGDFDFSSDSKQVLEVAKDFYQMMVKQEFLPNSPTIMNAGKNNGLQYSACFVLPVGDSLPEIFDAIKYAALIHQTGGGTGMAFSRLRPAGSMVKTTGGVASGPVSFLRVFNAATESIKQGGTRRGANMGILRVDHPDILDFIRCKATLDEYNQSFYDATEPYLSEDVKEMFKKQLLDKQIANFNISVAITDKFMEAYYKDEDYDLIDPHTKKAIGKLNSKEVFDEIIDRAWATGDPGVVFIDRINHSSSNPVPELEEIEATNPCGEQPLGPFDACNLGSINLGKFVLADGSDVDWESLREVTQKAVHFLDNVVQVNPYTLPQIYEEVHRNRRIGLGVMGWADMLFKLRIPYNSEEALELGEKIMKFINSEGHITSQELAKERGPFPNFAHSIYKHEHLLRNSTITTIAPTGTISIIGDCSSGIEPVFALAYIHQVKRPGIPTRVLTIANQTFSSIAKAEGFYSEDLAAQVMERGTVRGMDDVVPKNWQEVFVTAPEIAPDWHVKMQASFQKYTDNGVSKTINLPNSASRDDISKAYLMAWETGCNGITIYRDGSKSTQVLNVSSTLKTDQAQVTKEDETLGARPVILRGRTYKINTPVGEAFITINRDNQDRPFEVFVTIGKAGMHTSADAEAIGRLISLALRVARPDSKEIARKIAFQLRGIGGASQIGFGKDRVMSLADAIAKAMSEDLAVNGNGEAAAEPIPLDMTQTNDQMALSGADLCPECGLASFVMEEGCQKCYSCGYSKC